MRFWGASRSSNRRSSIRDVRSGTSVRFPRNNDRSTLQNALDVVLYNNVAHHLQSQLSYRTAQEERQSIIEQSQLWDNDSVGGDPIFQDDVNYDEDLQQDSTTTNEPSRLEPNSMQDTIQDFVCHLQRRRKRTNKDNLLAEAANWRLHREKLVFTYRDVHLKHTCSLSCRKKSTAVTCVDFLTFEIRKFTHCRTTSLSQQLIANGYFPATPERPSIAFSINVLRCFQAIQEHGKCSKEAFSYGLLLFHEQLQLQELVNAQMRHHFAEYFHDAHAHWLTIDALSREKCYAQLNLVHLQTVAVVPDCRFDSSMFGTAALHEMCPACFGWNASEVDVVDSRERPSLIFCLDGNMQHKRFKREEESQTVHCPITLTNCPGNRTS